MKDCERENVRAYHGNDPFIFISYAHEDSKLVLSIISVLGHNSYRIWYDEGIAPAEEFEPEIFQNLHNSTCAILFVSDGFLRSDWCKKELHKCLEYKKSFLLVFLEGIRPQQDYLNALELNENEKAIVGSKNHIFWEMYDNKRVFYEKLEECSILKPAKGSVDLESQIPVSRIVYDTCEIKRKVDDSLQFSDKLAFGKYPTGADGELGDIIWRVIAVETERILLLSEYLLDARHFHEKAEEVCWESCDLRKWLNSEFYDQAFGEEEKADILTSRISTLPNHLFGTDCGNEVENPVFLLSAEELYLYFTKNPKSFYHQTDAFQTVGPDSFLQAKYTEYAGTRTSYRNKSKGLAGWWWLRTSGSTKTAAATVNSTPRLNMEGLSVKFPPDGPKPAGGVRPAIWIRR